MKLAPGKGAAVTARGSVLPPPAPPEPPSPARAPDQMLLSEFVRQRIRPIMQGWENEQRAKHLSDPRAYPIDREEREWWRLVLEELNKRAPRR